MSSRSTVTLTTGKAGSGKTLSRGPRFLIDDFLRFGTGVHWSNFPWEFDPWTDGNAIERPGMVATVLDSNRRLTKEDVLRRIRVIPREELLTWRNFGGAIKGVPKDAAPYERWHGPWHFFPADVLKNAHVVIDEFHKICSTKAPAELVQCWQHWLGELRHQGATAELISQHMKKIHGAVIAEAEQRIELLKGDHKRDGCFGIEFYDWYQLRAKLVGAYNPASWEITYREVKGRWEETEAVPFWMGDRWFGCYDSHEAPIGQGQEDGAATEAREWERFSWPALLWWFVRRNAAKLVFAKVNLIWLVLLCLCFIRPLVTTYINTTKEWAKGKAVKQHEAQAEKKYVDFAKTEPTPVNRARFTTEELGFGSRPVMPVSRSVVSKPDAGTAAAGEELDELKSFQAENEKLRDALDELTTILDGAFAVSLMTPHSIQFRAGYEYEIGQTIDYGPHQGLALDSIDYARRKATLSDGTILRMGIGLDSGSASDWLQKQLHPEEKAEAAHTDFSRTLRPAQQRTSQPPTRTATRSVDNTFSPGATAGPVRAEAGRSPRDISRASERPSGPTRQRGSFRTAD